MTQDTYEFKDASGLVIHVKHIFVPLKTATPIEPGLSENPKQKWKKEIHQQPSSQIYVEVPENCGLSVADVYQAFTGKTAPEGYKPKDGNRLKVGTVTGMWNQPEVIDSLEKSGLFEKQTIIAVNNCCDNPTPAPISAQAVSTQIK